jgi:hypothetical protein
VTPPGPGGAGSPGDDRMRGSGEWEKLRYEQAVAAPSDIDFATASATPVEEIAAALADAYRAAGMVVEVLGRW